MRSTVGRVDELPDEPLAWLKRVSKNKAIDQYRRNASWRSKEKVLASFSPDSVEFDLDGEPIGDDLLRLIFTCCHPSLAPEAQIALTLRTVCGLTSDEVARAFLIKPTTLQQRIVRAKRKIDSAKIPYVVPDRESLPVRMTCVLRTIYLVFNEGYGATVGSDLVRHDLCEEGIRLARLVVSLLPDPAAKGLLALLLLQHSRRDARTDEEGDLITLDEQDRSRWDATLIDEALPLVEESLRGPEIATYAIEAAIAALHAQAKTPEETDWPQIAALYTTLYHRSDQNPVVALNRAVAIAMAGDLDDGLRRLDRLAQTGQLAHYHFLPAARGELLKRLGRLDEARDALKEALRLAKNEPEKRLLKRRLSELPTR